MINLFAICEKEQKSSLFEVYISKTLYDNINKCVKSGFFRYKYSDFVFQIADIKSGWGEKKEFIVE